MAGANKVLRHHVPCGAWLALIRYCATMCLVAQKSPGYTRACDDGWLFEQTSFVITLLSLYARFYKDKYNTSSGKTQQTADDLKP
jgi:hypothetical protein